MTNQNKIFDSKGLCPSCFSEIGLVPECPICGYQRESVQEDDWNKLALGSVIHDRYLIGRTLGQGGFGITYLGFDLRLKTKLAIKEYYPSGLAVRNTTNRTVMNASRDVAADFKQGMDKFLEEARTLARFEDYPSIVSVRDFFEFNGTAYMVMNYLEGKTMLKYLNDKGGVISFDETITILAPIMDALNEVHASGLIHRDISPDNVFLTDSGQVRLLDFGAAKSAMAMVNQQSHSIVLKKGYSPAEQYQSRGSLGPWTDIYSMAATIYRSIVGKVPPDSIDRMGEDALIPPSQQGIQIPDYAEVALLRALSISSNVRQQNMEDFKQDLLGEKQTPFVAEPVQKNVKKTGLLSKVKLNPEEGTVVKQASGTSSDFSINEKKKIPLVIIVVAIVVIVAIGGFMLISSINKNNKKIKPIANTTVKNEKQTDKVDFNENSPLFKLDALRKKAEGGDMVSQYKLASIFQQGKGVPQDTRMAAQWYRKSAEQGYAPAQSDLGSLYVQGLGVPRNHEEAEKWLSKSAEQGNPYAQASLGWLYDNGMGVPENKQKAVALYQAAVAQGHAVAHANLAYMYEKGLGGLKVDFKKAAELNIKAAEQGVTNAQYTIGLYYESGVGVPKDKGKAIQWLKKAAQQGDDDAINKLKSMGVTSSQNNVDEENISTEASQDYDFETEVRSDFKRLGKINGTKVNLREKPDDKARVIYQFPGWENVTIYQATEPKPGKLPWYGVVFQSGNSSVKGWVYGQFVKLQ